jgi:Flp pilus assembly protein TadG
MRQWRYWKDKKGASSAEFALVLLPFFAMVVGIIVISVLLFASQTLQASVEAAARCYSIGSASCTSAGATQTYAASLYNGPGTAPVFAASATGCGHTVTGSTTIGVNAIVVDLSIPLSAGACYP